MIALGSELASNYLESAISANVDLSIDPLSIFTHKLKGMAGVTVYIVITVWGATVRVENQNLVNTLGVLGKIILKKRQMSDR